MSRLLCIAILALAPPVAATEYFVSTTGNNANACTAGGTSACATINGAIAKATADSNGCGDIVTIQAGTHSGTVDIPNMNCTTPRFILQGDPAVAASSIVVAGKVTIGTGTNVARGGYTIKHMKFAAPTLPMFDVRCTGASSTETRNVTLDDIVITAIPAPSTHAGGSAPKYALGLNKADGSAQGCSSSMGPIVIQNSNFSNGGTRARVNMLLGFNNFTLQDSTISDQAGHIYYGSSRTSVTMTRNTFKNAQCTCVVDPCSGDTEADGDGCIIGYNNIMSITHNVFDGVSGNDDADGVNAVVNARRTDSGTSPVMSFTIDHNTFIAATPTANNKDNALFTHSPAGSNGIVTNNIFVGYGGSTTPWGAAIVWRACPSNKSERNNLFYQSAGNRDIYDEGGNCGGTNGYGTGDMPSTSNANPFSGCATPATCPGGPYVPPISSAVCGAASDGTTIGARACAGTAGTAPSNVNNLRRTDKP